MNKWNEPQSTLLEKYHFLFHFLLFDACGFFPLNSVNFQLGLFTWIFYHYFKYCLITFLSIFQFILTIWCVLMDLASFYDRLHSLSEYVVEEKCSFCYASVPFESSEDAFCKGAECNSAAGQCHRLARCAISMQVCPTTSLWFCKCCRRWVSKLAPQTFFTMSKSPLDLMSLIRSTDLQEHPKALCPFCGILLQRLLPEFLLSPSPV